MKRRTSTLATILGLCFALCDRAGADVVISEIMYHPASEVSSEEFLELFNTGASAVDLAGWCVSGIDFCFGAGASIGDGEYLVLAEDAAQFQATYGFPPDGVYSGKLSNAGELLELLDASTTVVDQVAYGDEGDWPVTPDGLGPSLERIDPTLDGDTPRNWRASVNAAGHTAGAVNSVDAVGLPPWISEVQYPIEPSPGDPVTVTATIEDASTVGLTYVVDFDAEVALTMFDDGAHGDGASGDGVYGVTIPGQPAATLVRFRIETSGATGVMQHPRDDDTVNYVGTMVADPSLVTALPVFHWFIDPADYQAALDHASTNDVEPAVLYHDSVLYDNIQIRVRGQTSRTWPKKQWKFRFPVGHDFFHPDLVPVAVDQLNMQSNYSDKSYCREILSYETFRAAGSPSSLAFHVRLQQNGEFYGLYTYLEAMDADYLARNGLDKDGAWYKAFDDCRYRTLEDLPDRYEKERRVHEDYLDLFTFLDGLNNLSGQARTDFLFDNLDIPGMVNYLAATNIIHNNDHIKKNYFFYRDSDGTQRWVMHPWDMDLTMGRNFGGGGGVLGDVIWADNDDIGRPNVSPSHPLFGDADHQKWDNLWNRLIHRLYEIPAFHDMYHRRLRSLMDELLFDGRFEDRIDELAAPLAAEVDADRAKWGWYGQDQTLEQAIDLIKNDYLPRRRHHLFVNHRVPGEIPPAQSPAPQVIINELMYAPAGVADAEFVELYNPSVDESVDLSGWRLEGVGLTFPNGTVLLPEDYLVVVRHDVTFRATYGSGIYVAAEYGGRLNNAGEGLVLLDSQRRSVDVVRYDDQAPWPTSPDGTGPSLELIDQAGDNGRVANWEASVPDGGTPGAPNSVQGTVPAIPALYLNEVSPSNVSMIADEQGDFDPWLELYNASASTIDLSGMLLSDDYGLPAQWAVPDGTQLAAGAWLVVWMDGEPSEGPLHTSFALNPLTGSVALYLPDETLVDYLNYDALAADVSYGRFPDGDGGRGEFALPTPGAANAGSSAALILNEYNGVRPDRWLDCDGQWCSEKTDTFFGRVQGNGLDWFELVVIQDHLDLRGWQLEWEELGGDLNAGTLTLSDDPLWSDLLAGTIITFTESDSSHGGLDTDTSFDPASGDWWININTLVGDADVGDPEVPQEQYVTTVTSSGSGPGHFSVSHDDWQLRIKDAGGTWIFGPAGEVVSGEGVNSREVFKLEETPTVFIDPQASDYNDGTSSTFGAPNVYADGTSVQDFSTLRFAPCTDAADCDDGNPCTLDTCDAANACQHANVPDGTSCDSALFCQENQTCTGGLCGGGAALDCGDGLDCTTDLCNDYLDDCVHNINPGTCLIEGECYNVSDLHPANDCEECNSAESQTAWSPRPAGSACGDPADDDCTDPDTCDGAGACQVNDELDGTSCEDGMFCTDLDACQSGVCVAGGSDPCTEVCEQCDDEADTCQWCIFDMDGSGAIASGDFNWFAFCYGSCYEAEDPCAVNNFDGDVEGCVASGDFSGFAFCYGAPCDACANCWPAWRGGARAPAGPEGQASLAVVAVRTPGLEDTADVLPASMGKVVVGQRFHLELWASRQSDWGAGLAAVHADLSYEPKLLTVEGVAVSDLFGLFTQEVIGPQDGTVPYLGGCAQLGEDTLGIDPAWVRVATLQVRARAAGVAAVDTDWAGERLGVSILGEFGNLDASQIDFGRTRVEIAKPAVNLTPEAIERW